jgi:hypothetical protein
LDAATSGQLFTAGGAADRLAVTCRSRDEVSLADMTHDDSPLTRRQMLAGAGGVGMLAVAGPVSVLGSARPARAASAGAAADGTPEQIHLTWGADPASSVTVSWASPARANRPRVGADPVNPTTGEPGTPSPDYTEFETFTLVRPRSDRFGRRGEVPERVPASVPGG